jgi:signal peptidase I
MKDRYADFMPMGDKTYLVNLTKSEAGIVRKMPGAVLNPEPGVNKGLLFPFSAASAEWDTDNYGTIWIPKKGVTVTLSPANIDLYRRIIVVYEGNKLEEQGGKYSINGKETTTYTFKMNYYWMMGDNRHRSQDSRFWGFVPEDHIVGKAKLIWFSYEKGGGGVRWSRLFRSVK